MTKTFLFLFLFLSSLIIAQQQPLAVESSSLLEAGNAQFDFGFSHFRNQPFPLAGLTGNLTKVGRIRFVIALSELVELQTDGTLLDILDVTKRDSAFNSLHTTHSNPTGDIGDFSVWTKFSLFNEYQTGIGVSARFGVQLPNASNESGLGIDEMNFFTSLLFQKHIGGLLTVNLGLGILGDPIVAGQQHDVFTYGIEYSLPVREATYLLFQSEGRKGHSGIGIPHLENIKIGLDQAVSSFSLRLFGVFNISPVDHAKGIEASISYLFHVIDIQK